MSCKDRTSVKNEKEYVSLLKYGIPFDLNAPEDVHIRASASGNQKNVFVSNNKNYDIHISMSAALNRNRENLKAQTKKALVEDPNFSKIIEEMEDGFIYEKEYGDARGYDFYIVKIQGNHELTFQCGNGGIYTETEVKSMVRSVLSEY
jgi:hypothetical protein